jgi:hypothetical protein
VAVWWRDPPLLGPWGAEGVVALASLVALALLFAVIAVVAVRTTGRPVADAGPQGDGAAAS